MIFFLPTFVTADICTNFKAVLNPISNSIQLIGYITHLFINFKFRYALIVSCIKDTKLWYMVCAIAYDKTKGRNKNERQVSAASEILLNENESVNDTEARRYLLKIIP